MNIVVVLGALALTVLLGWYFFGPRTSKRAAIDGDLQVQTITVKGGYSPSLIELVQGVPTRLLFDRQETGDCTSHVVFPDFKVNRRLPAYATTAIEFVPDEVGDFDFACGMNMIHGTVKVVSRSADGQRATTALLEAPVTTQTSDTAAAATTDSGDLGDRESAEHAREIADLLRRVSVGAVLTLPVFLSVMAHDIFGAMWVPLG